MIIHIATRHFNTKSIKIYLINYLKDNRIPFSDSHIPMNIQIIIILITIKNKINLI